MDTFTPFRRIAPTGSTLRIRRLGLHTQREPIVVLRSDCVVCRSEGLAPRSQILLTKGERTVAAILFQGADDFLQQGEIGLSEAAWNLLGGTEGEVVHISHSPPLASMSSVRRRLFGKPLGKRAFRSIVNDVVAGRYSDVQLSAFISATSALPLSDDETFGLTSAMAQAGDRLAWPGPTIDKHSVGGLPGNRTTPILVSIVAAAGLTIPKTSSRAITSPAGTADAMETVTCVDLDLAAIRKVVEAEGGCLAWGGALKLSPADDVFIGVERQLDVDPEGQLIASVLSKKIAAGANRLVLDIPVGPTAKVRSAKAGRRLAERLRSIASRFGIAAKCILTDGAQPVGRAIGPALEMIDVLAVLRLEKDAPQDLRERALQLSGVVLEHGGVAPRSGGYNLARDLLDSGCAYRKFERICVAQGGFREPSAARLQRELEADRSGRIQAIDNRKIARLAKFAGAPDCSAAGVQMHVKVGEWVNRGDRVLTIHSDTSAELGYALDYCAAVGSPLTIQG